MLGPHSHYHKLLKQGTERDSENSEALTPLGEASRSGHLEAVKLLLPCASASHLNNAFLSAARSHWPRSKTTKLLLEAGANMDALDSAGTALHQAAYRSQPRIVQMLLARRVSLELRDKDGRTPLLGAVRQNSVECVQLLVEAGANVNAKDENGHTPLFEAASKGYTNCVRILIAVEAGLWIPPSLLARYNDYLDLELSEFTLEVFRVLVDYVSEGRASFEPRISSSELRRYLEKDSYDVNGIDILLGIGLNPNLAV